MRYWKPVLGSLVTSMSAAALIFSLTSKSSAAAPQLVYICSSQPCANAQELEVFDKNQAPVFSVGEFGGDAVFGDNRSVYPPSSVFSPSVVESYTTPAGYGRTSCVSPEIWISPSGIYACHSGRFILEVRL